MKVLDGRQNPHSGVLTGNSLFEQERGVERERESTRVESGEIDVGY